jgi:hypothetical protein
LLRLWEITRCRPGILNHRLRERDPHGDARLTAFFMMTFISASEIREIPRAPWQTLPACTSSIGAVAEGEGDDGLGFLRKIGVGHFSIPRSTFRREVQGNSSRGPLRQTPVVERPSSADRAERYPVDFLLNRRSDEFGVVRDVLQMRSARPPRQAVSIRFAAQKTSQGGVRFSSNGFSVSLRRHSKSASTPPRAWQSELRPCVRDRRYPYGFVP